MSASLRNPCSLPRSATVTAIGLLLLAAGSTATDVRAVRSRPAAVAVAVPVNQAPTTAAALAPAANGSHLVFYRGQDDGVYQRTVTDGGWGSESGLGGLIVGAPAAATAGTSTHVLAARGRNSALYLRTFSQGGWGAWQSLSGILSAAPAVVGAGDGRQDVFVRGANNALYTRTKVPGGTWSAWKALGGALASGPAAVSLASGRIDVFALGTDYSVWRRSLAAGTWSAWSRLGGRTYTAPAAARGPDGSAWLFVRGTNDALFVHDAVGWHSLAGLLIDAPAASTTSTGGIDVVVRGRDNALWRTRLRTGPSWTAFQRAWTPAAPLSPPSSLMGVDWQRIPTTAKVVALTFDAGGNSNGLASIRNTLQTKNVPATFFLTGAWSRSFPARANEVAIAGFRIGNHTDTHPDLTTLSDAAVRAQVLNAQQAILLSTGADSRPLFRFPYGAVNARVLGLVNGMNYGAVRWSVDSLGWQGTSGGQTNLSVANRVYAARQPGEIVLMHVGSNPNDGSTLDAAALPQIIDRLRADGYSFVTLNALLGS